MSGKSPQTDFKELSLRLIAYGVRVFGEFGLTGKDAIISGTGLSIEDFVAKILLEYTTGKLKHHSSRGKLITLLARALRNDVIDALRKAAHNKEDPRTVTADDDESEMRAAPAIDEYPASTRDPVNELDEERYKAKLRTLLSGEPDLVEVVEAVLDLDLREPEDIANVLGITAEDVQNRKKKLRRRLIQHGVKVAAKLEAGK